ncbi:MAG TPA: phosphate signaling complex protein PhoU [Chromatiales bacterium]|nr:phosphate signaling complex protein PhoU [Chromatiales bacterium]
MNDMTSGHTVERYNKELGALHQTIIKASQMVCQQIRDAVQSLEDEDVERAREVVLRDRDIDTLELKVDDMIVHLIAKRQPMARDLREVLAAGKIMSDIERIGDQTRRLARLTILLYESDNHPPNARMLSDIPRLAKHAEQMLEKASEAFANLAIAPALEVIRMDADLDEEIQSALRKLSTYLMEDARSIGHVVDITLAFRAIDRMGGHAAYIARHTIFLVKGKDVRHESLEEVVREVADEASPTPGGIENP